MLNIWEGVVGLNVVTNNIGFVMVSLPVDCW